MYGDLGGIGPFWSIVAVIGRGDGQNATLRRLETRILSLKVSGIAGYYIDYREYDGATGRILSF